MKHIYTSVDIGSSAIKIVVCELYKGKLNLLAATSAKSSGIKKGLITDFESATESLKKAVFEIESMLGIPIKKVIVSVPAYFSEYKVVKNNININNKQGLVTGDEIIGILQDAVLKNSVSGKEVVTMLPIDFSIDEHERIKDPKGLFGKELHSRAVMVATPKKNIYSVLSLLENAGLEAVDISLNPIGDIYAFKTKKMDSEVGTIIDIGAETTTVSLYNRGVLVRCSIIGVGSKTIDNDLAYIFKTSFNNAKMLKEHFCVAHKKYASLNETIDITNEHGENININQQEASEVVMSRLEEILSLAKNEIKSLTEHKIDYTIVTGGITNMPYFEQLAQYCLKDNTIVGNVRLVGIRNNKYSVCIGNIVYFINKLKLKGKDCTMITENDSAGLVETKKSLINNISNDSALGKLFNYFFSE